MLLFSMLFQLGCSVYKSATRKEELLLEKEVINRIWILRKVLHPMNTVDAMEFLLDKIMSSKTNKMFLDSMSS